MHTEPRITILILVFFPVLSYFSYKIDSSFKEETNTILSEVQNTDQQLGIDTFFGDNKSDISNDDGKPHGMLQSLREKASHTMNMLSLENMKTKMTAFSDNLQDKTDRLFNIFTAFALSVFIIPLFIIAVFVKILQIISSQIQAAYRQVQQETKKMIEE